MPCYQINTISIDFEAANVELLKRAARAIGLTVEVTTSGIYVNRAGRNIAVIRGGKATCSPSDLPTLNKLRVQYSKEVVNHAALKLGWQKSMKSENKLILRKGV